MRVDIWLFFYFSGTVASFALKIANLAPIGPMVSKTPTAARTIVLYMQVEEISF